MSKDDRDVLEVLKAELDFIEKGGYGRSVRTPWQPTSIFQDSLSCLNLGDPTRAHKCEECLLIDFVPTAEREEHVPCHHILLGSAGQTVEAIELQEDQLKMEEAVKDWLRDKIKQVERERMKQSIN